MENHTQSISHKRNEVIKTQKKIQSIVVAVRWNKAKLKIHKIFIIIFICLNTKAPFIILIVFTHAFSMPRVCMALSVL